MMKIFRILCATVIMSFCLLFSFKAFLTILILAFFIVVIHLLDKGTEETIKQKENEQHEL
jgi:diacylglycerol kinase